MDPPLFSPAVTSQNDGRCVGNHAMKGDESNARAYERARDRPCKADRSCGGDGGHRTCGPLEAHRPQGADALHRTAPSDMSRHGSLWRGTFLGPALPGAWPYRAADRAPVCETLREVAQKRSG